MGIKGLMQVLRDSAPGCLKEQTIKNYFGRKIAIDASMCLYQFLIAVRMDGQSLTNEDGEVTSHLQGIFYRTMRMLDAGIKPVYVFDGKPPQMKSDNELKKRAERRAETSEELKEALEVGADADDIEKLERRLVRVTKEQNLEVQRLLTLMGIPWIEAVCEAEATCAELAKKGLVYGTGTEDMDALTFGTTKLIRNITVSEARNLPIFEIDFEKMLKELNMTHKEFVDFCILLGCDYTTTIKGIGPKTALELIHKHKSIDKIVEEIDLQRHPIPAEFHPAAAADLFINAEVNDVEDLNFEWKKPDEQGLIDFLVTEKAFAEERVRGGIKRMLEARKHMTQQRLETWFTPKAMPAASTSIKNPAKVAAEKKALEAKEAEKKKKEEEKKKRDAEREAAKGITGATKRKASDQPAAVKKAKK